MKSFFVENVLEDQDFLKLKDLCLIALKDSKYTPQIGRWHADVYLDDDLNSKFLNMAKNKFNVDDLTSTYVQVVKYQIVDNAIPTLNKHKDQLACTHTIDMTIETTVDWGLFVEDTFFKDIPNCAVFLKGDDEEHYRPKYPSKNNNDYCIVLFINYATSDHWSAKIVKGASDKALKLLKTNRIDYLI